MPDDEIRQVPRDELDSELEEGWQRLPSDPNDCEVRGVEVSKWGDEHGRPHWNVTLWAAEFLREDPLVNEMDRGIDAALRAVDGVTDVEHVDTEMWYVHGTPSGYELTRAAADFVDDSADLWSAFIEAMRADPNA